MKCTTNVLFLCNCIWQCLISGLCYGYNEHLECITGLLNFILYIFRAIDTNKLVIHRYIAVVFKYITAACFGHCPYPFAGSVSTC